LINILLNVFLARLNIFLCKTIFMKIFIEKKTRFPLSEIFGSSTTCV